MAYTVAVNVNLTDPERGLFRIVEAANFYYGNGCYWGQQSGPFTLNMGQSGTSGMLRLMTTEETEPFVVALGVHNYKPWVDIVCNLTKEDTCIKVLPEYYNSGPRAFAREATRTTWSATNSQKRKFTATYTVKDGHDLELDILIG